MPRKVTPEVIEKIKLWEGRKLTAYKDTEGNWTIGYGHTGNVIPGMTITETQATKYLKEDLSLAESCVNNNVHVDLTDNQFGALVSFTFNVGTEAFRTSTLLKKLNAGNYAAVPIELAKWNKITKNKVKVVDPGLVNRRSAEIGLWASGSFVASNTVSVVAPSQPVSAGTAGGIVGTVAAAGAATAPIISSVAGFQDWKIVAVLAVAVLVGGVVFLIWKKQQ